MRFSYIIIVCVFSFFSASAQVAGAEKQNSEVSDTTYSVMYNKLKELYKKQIESHSYKHVEMLRKEFIKRANITDIRLAEKSKMLAWIESNIVETDFVDYKSALLEYEAIYQAHSKMIMENTELYELIPKAVKIHGSRIFAKVMMDVEFDYPY